jgi:TonB family protein
MVPAVVLSIGVHVALGVALVIAALVTLVGRPSLQVTIDALSEEGGDRVQVFAADQELICEPGRSCTIDLHGVTHVRVLAHPGPGSTFDGWQGCEPSETNVLLCKVAVRWEKQRITVLFGKKPDEQELAIVETQPPDDIALPEPAAPRPDQPKPEEIEAEKLEEAVEVAMIDPLPPDFVPPPPPPPVPPPPPPPQKKEEVPPPPPEMRSVEVPDENEVQEAPDDATHLSDKNRDVAEESRAIDTNLEKEAKGEEPDSAPSDIQSDDIGGPDDEIAQLEDSQATTHKRVATSDHSGDHDAAKGAITGEAGEGGEGGTGERKEPGALAMRGIDGRGDVIDQKGDGKRKGKKGKPGMKTQLEFDDYERIVGKDKAEKERAIAQRDRSMKKGRYKKKLDAIKSALENFTPDVRPGNQTALKTRAHPFAIYLARMHRRIHELWGFGFLEDLDNKPADHKLNNFDLFTSIEVAINPDGSVYKMTVVKASGHLEFDVAAMHTIQTAAPYEQTPEKIRSVDQRVYLRWGFYRNWRQCGTFNVEPYILTEIPGGVVALDDGMDTRDGKASGEGDVAAIDPERGTRPVTPEPPKGSGASGGDHAHDHDHVGNNHAKYAANMWIAGLTTGSVKRMLKVSAVPFYAGAEIVASDKKQLGEVLEALMAESGALKGWELLTAAEYGARAGNQVQLSEGALVIYVETNEKFGIVLVPTTSGEYRANAVLR